MENEIKKNTHNGAMHLSMTQAHQLHFHFSFLGAIESLAAL